MKKKLDNLAFICAKNSRSIAYLHFLEKFNLLPSTIISIDVKKQYRNIKPIRNKYFKFNLDIKKFSKKNNINFFRIKKSMINDSKYYNIIKSLKEKYIIYAANYGDILKKKYFLLNKKFIHIHPGKLPRYKGSTTYYYEILEKNSISFSAIFQNSKIDEGRIIKLRQYKINQLEKSNLDHIFDPYLRSKLLIDVMMEFKKKGYLSSRPQTKSGKYIYYVIHPLLKHIAILSKS